jgi:hypothetical protein
MRMLWGRAVLVILVAFVASRDVVAAIPATPVLTLYRFNGEASLPYFDAEQFSRSGTASAPVGRLPQGTTLIPCLLVRGGRPLTDDSGTPFVGFEVVVDPRNASPESTARLKEAIAQRKTLTVDNHHCEPSVRHVIDVRNLYPMEKAPFFDPPRSAAVNAPAEFAQAGTEPDAIVRAFHNSAQCAQVNETLTGRRSALLSAWSAFQRDHSGRWPERELASARDLDFTMRTALFEGHLGRGCNAYGACERNIVALSIRNRAMERCFAREGCGERGDFTGVASIVSQYNIWDEFLTQISGLTACYLRDDLSALPYYAKLQAMYAQNAGDVQRILFGTDADLLELFPGASLDDIRRTAHYYHAPAMGKCFPQHDRVEYMSGAVASRGDDFALIANTRVHVGDKVGDDYRFRLFGFEETDERDVVEMRDAFPGFLIDGRKVTLVAASGCRPYGIPSGCQHGEIGRYRKVPSWLDAGKPIGLTCRIADRAETCDAPSTLVTVQVGGMCDTQMRPVSGVH